MQMRWIEYRAGCSLNLFYVAAYRVPDAQDGPDAKIVLYLVAHVDGRKKLEITDAHLAGKFLLAVRDSGIQPGQDWAQGLIDQSSDTTRLAG